MKSLKIASHLVLAVLALALTASVGKSQVEGYKGTFTLPVEVRWGGATLPAGDYTLRVDSLSAPQVVRVEGEGKSALILVGSYDPLASPNQNQLILLENGHGYAVRSLRVGAYGVNLDFVVSRPKTAEYAGNGKSPATIQVAVRGGH